MKMETLLFDLNYKDEQSIENCKNYICIKYTFTRKCKSLKG